MSSVLSTGNLTLPSAQASPRQIVSPVAATEPQGPKIQSRNEDQNQRASEQVKTTPEITSQPSVKQESGEQQKIEAAQQEAQRAEFDQQVGNVRNTEPNDVRPPSFQQTDALATEKNQNKNIENARIENNRTQRETASANKPAIDAFNQFQNINAVPRQGQELNKFA